MPSIARHILRVVSLYVRLCAEKQNCCLVLVAGHRGSVICAGASCSAIKTTAVSFFQKIPPHKRIGALARQKSLTLRRGARSSGRLALPNALQPSHHDFARLSCCLYRAAASSLHTQRISRGKSVRPQASRCWLRQTLTVPAPSFVPSKNL